MPLPLQDRVFPVLIVSAMKKKNNDNNKNTSPGDDRFIDVQIGLEGLQHVPGSKHVLRNDVVVGMYTSVEAGFGRPHSTTWSTAVASDAAGSLPSWAQTPMMPSAIAKDVGFVMDWIRDRRANGGS